MVRVSKNRARPVNSIPRGFTRVSPMLSIKQATRGIEFYLKVFGGRAKTILKDESGTIFHSELDLGKGIIMLAEEDKEVNISPLTLGGNSAFFWIYVENVDEVYRMAIAEGSTSISEPETMFFGDRICRINDPFGYRWIIATRLEDVSWEEYQLREKEMKR